MDLGFLVDSSDGVNWNEMLAFVKTIIRSFDISHAGTHVGFISFASTANLNFDFATNPAPTTDVINNQINSITPNRGNQRRIDLALRAAAAKLFITDRAMRPLARKVSLCDRVFNANQSHPLANSWIATPSPHSCESAMH